MSKTKNKSHGRDRPVREKPGAARDSYHKLDSSGLVIGIAKHRFHDVTLAALRRGGALPISARPAAIPGIDLTRALGLTYIEAPARPAVPKAAPTYMPGPFGAQRQLYEPATLPQVNPTQALSAERLRTGLPARMQTTEGGRASYEAAAKPVVDTTLPYKGVRTETDSRRRSKVRKGGYQ